MKKLLIGLLLLGASVLKPSFDSMALIRERLRFLVDISDLSWKERQSLNKGIMNFDEKILELHWQEAKAISRYLDVLVPADLLESAKHLDVHAYGEKYFSWMGTKWGLLAGGLFLGTSAVLGLMSINASVSHSIGILALHTGVVFLAGFIVVVLVGAFLVELILAAVSEGIGRAKGRHPFAKRQQLRDRLSLHLQVVMSSALQVPDCLVNFQFTHFPQSKGALEVALKKGTLVKDLVSALA